MKIDNILKSKRNTIQGILEHVGAVVGTVILCDYLNVKYPDIDLIELAIDNWEAVITWITAYSGGKYFYEESREKKSLN